MRFGDAEAAFHTAVERDDAGALADILHELAGVLGGRSSRRDWWLLSFRVWTARLQVVKRLNAASYVALLEEQYRFYEQTPWTASSSSLLRLFRYVSAFLRGEARVAEAQRAFHSEQLPQRAVGIGPSLRLLRLLLETLSPAYKCSLMYVDGIRADRFLVEQGLCTASFFAKHSWAAAACPELLERDRAQGEDVPFSYMSSPERFFAAFGDALFAQDSNVYCKMQSLFHSRLLGYVWRRLLRNPRDVFIRALLRLVELVDWLARRVPSLGTKPSQSTHLEALRAAGVRVYAHRVESRPALADADARRFGAEIDLSVCLASPSSQEYLAVVAHDKMFDGIDVLEHTYRHLSQRGILRASEFLEQCQANSIVLLDDKATHNARKLGHRADLSSRVAAAYLEAVGGLEVSPKTTSLSSVCRPFLAEFDRRAHAAGLRLRLAYCVTHYFLLERLLHEVVDFRALQKNGCPRAWFHFDGIVAYGIHIRRLFAERRDAVMLAEVFEIMVYENDLPALRNAMLEGIPCDAVIVDVDSFRESRTMSSEASL